ncbi:UDP-3-O-acyl-N-acetylglucosamine deacetylase [Candidatus Persebacteraceae bacterium Df01]|jgi:UDP-3-O-[3-hydroxymyristoyl] N-acetylglucosamine deacetylase|uniref:UDP-3-O-acyl-N-acetylglucosamine deacetylase n=1 Tax=Candidatus Doriopsillibacter californiensis TaxID=2970740 RepID=A0ABT7QKM7_9GAMM|nr:UDP-3-O-acyl-N-acetylglucosamine deacetylase [Candidatus Persebacteraceae bacterium Df01]
MNAPAQQTIARSWCFSGTALHSGHTAHVKLLPADADSGIIFCRTDINTCIKADSGNVGNTQLATTLCSDNAEISTVEHLLSALSALTIDNLTVEVDGPELPILDGSSVPWMLLVTDACGITKQQVPRRQVKVLREVSVECEGACARFVPNTNGISGYAVRIDYPHEVVRRTGNCFAHRLGADDYEEEISRARTFCYINDVELMRHHHRALGGSLSNAVVYDDKGVLNTEGLRYPDEFVRHKVLDAIGDCYINGHQILADYEAERPGHGVNNALVRALMADKETWKWV